jgi:hypothetical protein
MWNALRDFGDWRDSWAAVVSDEKDFKQLWEQHGDAAIEDYAERNPGKRPFYWWRFSAPEPRARLRGKGVPRHDALAYVVDFDYGVPQAGFVSAWEWLYYNGQARHVDGHLIAEDRKLGDFPYQPFDKNDPPVYESQATYLRRHGLLLRGELKRLTETDFEPEVMTDDDNDD